MADTIYGPNPIQDSGKGGHSDQGTPEGSKGTLPDGTQGQELEPSTKRARSLEHRKENGNGIPVATKPNLSSVSSDPKVSGTPEDSEQLRMSEPHYAGVGPNDEPYVSAQYPYVHVEKSEAGHLRVVDDTLGGERLLTQHKIGTLDEYLSNGDKRVRIIGDGYEIIAGQKNIFIGAAGKANREDALNLTVNGNVRQLVKGDYILEVEGDYYEKIHGSRYTKIGAKGGGGNYEVEIRGNYSAQINEDYKLHVTEDYDLVVDKNRTSIINGKDTLGVTEGISLISTTGNILLSAMKNVAINTNDSSEGTISLKAASNIDARSTTTTDITAATSITITSGDGTPTSSSRITINNGTKGAARIDDTADTGDDPAGISGSDGSNKIETGSGTVFIGD